MRRPLPSTTVISFDKFFLAGAEIGIVAPDFDSEANFPVSEYVDEPVHASSVGSLFDRPLIIAAAGAQGVPAAGRAAAQRWMRF